MRLKCWLERSGPFWPRHSISELEKSFMGERHGSEKKKITAPNMSKPQVMAAASGRPNKSNKDRRRRF